MPAGSASFINPVTVQAHEDLLVRANGRPPSETQHPGATSTLQLHQLLPKPQSVRQCRLWCLTIAPSRTLCRHGHRRARAAPGPQQRGAPQLAAAESVRAAAPSPLPQECRAQRRRCWPTCGRCPRARRCAGQHQASRHWERHVSCSVPATAFLGPHWRALALARPLRRFPCLLRAVVVKVRASLQRGEQAHAGGAAKYLPALSSTHSSLTRHDA